MRQLLKGLILAGGLLAFALPAASPVLHAQDVDRGMYVSVLDKAGKPVMGLQPRDFTVREDGVAREVLHADPATDPITLAILVDTSQAATRYMQDIRPAVRSFIEQMSGSAMNGPNPIALISFGDRPTIVADYTTDRAALEKAAGGLFATPQSGAYLLDAITEVAHGLEARNPSRAVILAITTEGTDFSSPKTEAVLSDLKDSHAALDVVILGPPAPDILSESVRSRNLVIDRGTRETGGRVDHILSGNALRATLGHVADDLLHQYRLTYAHPETLIPPTKFSVSVNRPGLTARGTPIPREGRRP